jgi:urease accessory protein
MIMTTSTIITMTMAESPGPLLRLMGWLSPTFPVGAFAYSHGLERAIHDELIVDQSSLVRWLDDLVARGSGWNDAVLLAQAWREASAGRDCEDVMELAEAMAGSKERHMETTLQGAAFGEAIAAWIVPEGCRPFQSLFEGRPISYPVAVGMAAARHSLSLPETLTAYLHAFTSNLIQAAVRLVPLGQRDGVAALVALEPVILQVASRAARSSLDDLGSATFFSDLLSMRHETQYSRVFRS